MSLWFGVQIDVLNVTKRFKDGLEILFGDVCVKVAHIEAGGG